MKWRNFFKLKLTTHAMLFSDNLGSFPVVEKGKNSRDTIKLSRSHVSLFLINRGPKGIVVTNLTGPTHMWPQKLKATAMELSTSKSFKS